MINLSDDKIYSCRHLNKNVNPETNFLSLTYLKVAIGEHVIYILEFLLQAKITSI